MKKSQPLSSLCKVRMFKFLKTAPMYICALRCPQRQQRAVFCAHPSLFFSGEILSPAFAQVILTHAQADAASAAASSAAWPVSLLLAKNKCGREKKNELFSKLKVSLVSVWKCRKKRKTSTFFLLHRHLSKVSISRLFIFPGLLVIFMVPFFSFLCQQKETHYLFCLSLLQKIMVVVVVVLFVVHLPNSIYINKYLPGSTLWI